MSHTHTESGSARHAGKLKAALALTLAYMLTEVVAGFLTNSLALLADAGHMLMDVAGLVLALFAINMAERPSTPQGTYGYYRAEILAALANAVPRTWRLISDAVSVLLEGTPAEVNLAEVRKALESIAGVSGGRDLHVWALTSGVNALSVHVVANDTTTANNLLGHVTRCASEQLRISHVTVQVEPPGWRCEGPHA